MFFAYLGHGDGGDSRGHDDEGRGEKDGGAHGDSFDVVCESEVVEMRSGFDVGCFV